MLPLVVSPQPCVYRRRAMETLTRARYPWRVAYSCPSLAGTQAALRAGLGVSVLPRGMLALGLSNVGPLLDLPALSDTEIALYTARGLASPAVSRLAEYIQRALEEESADALEAPATPAVEAAPLPPREATG
jgi:DNA-binding transcriptional LysR family regulator